MLREVTLEGERVRLEPLRPHHVDELWEPASDPEVWKLTTVRIATKKDLEAYVEKRCATLAQGTGLPFIQRDARAGDAMGATTLFDIDLKHRRMEIGHTWLGRRWWGTGVNFEAKYLLLRHAFEELRAIRVQFKTDHRNVRAQGGIEKAGGRREGVLRNQMVLPDGSYRQAVLYSIIESEWPELRRRLEARIDRGPRQERP